ncbi:MAG: DUF3159 domain-containing protein [Acidimicrobiia bacterium]|nr:DUF3159 domain-containing protein [Acidimicrobiia bacterium]
MPTSSFRDQLSDFITDLRDLFVGERTLGDALLPPIVFVATQRELGVGWAAVLALGVASLFIIWRWRKRGSISYAFGGVATVALAVFFALRSGEAEDFFIPGIVSAFFWAAAGTASIVARRPFVVFASAFYRRWPIEWYWRDDVRPAYTVVSWWWVAYTLLRGAGQLWFFSSDRVELLLTFKLLTSFPTSVPLMFASYVYGNRKLHRLGGPTVTEHLSDAEAPFAGGQHGF